MNNRYTAQALLLDVDEDRVSPSSEPLRGGELRVARFTGVNALMAAVLEEAIRNYCHGSALMRADVELWIADRHATWPFSFRSICEHLGLHPSAVWAELRRRVPAVAVRPARSRGNVRVTRRLG